MNDLTIYHKKILKLASTNRESLEIKDFNFSKEVKNLLNGMEFDVAKEMIKSGIETLNTDIDIESSDSSNFSEMILFVVFGIVALSLGADLFVDGAVFIARFFGISEVVIGMSVVAFGTSLPELATSAMAAFKKQSEISLGNIIGSNIFNILCVLGVTSIIEPLNSKWGDISFQVLVMVFYGFLIFLAAKLPQPFNRKLSALMLTGYFVFIYLLF